MDWFKGKGRVQDGMGNMSIMHALQQVVAVLSQSDEPIHKGMGDARLMSDC